MAEQITDVRVEEGWTAIEVTEAAEVQQWARDLLEAAGPDRNADVKTEHHRGAVIVFVVPNDVANAALKARKKRTDADAKAEAAAKKAAESQGAKDDKRQAAAAVKENEKQTAETTVPAGGPAAPAGSGADASGDSSAAGS